MNQQQLIDHLLKLNPMLTEAGAISIINTVKEKENGKRQKRRKEA